MDDSRSVEIGDVVRHYASGYEAARLDSGPGKLERERSRELLQRFLPPAPAVILDVGGGPGGYACWLARQGHQVHLVDISPVHVRLAREGSAGQSDAPLAGATVGDARSLPYDDGAADAVLLFGPLYHLTDGDDRLRALQEAQRVLKPGGILLAVGISRFASALDGLCKGFLKDPQFVDIVHRDLKSGQHTNPTGKPEYFMDTFFHHPDGLRDEMAASGFIVTGVFGIEGLGWLVRDFDEWWDTGELRDALLRIARTLETEPSLLGMSAHLLAVATKDW